MGAKKPFDASHFLLQYSMLYLSTNREYSGKRWCSYSNKAITWTLIVKNYACHSLAKKPLPHTYFIFRDVNVLHVDGPRHEAHGTYVFFRYQLQRYYSEKQKCFKT